jgi:HSP20 family molecular chaperone IbpA
MENKHSGELQARRGYNYDLFSPFFDFFNDADLEREARDFGLMRTDIDEQEDGYNIYVEMPGVDKKDIKVSLENGYLTVSYSIDSTHKDKKHLHVERRSGTYRREYFVGYEAKKDEIKASLENGVLTLFVPKAKKEENENKFIEIK